MNYLMSQQQQIYKVIAFIKPPGLEHLTKVYGEFVS